MKSKSQSKTEPKTIRQKASDYWHMLGPGLTTGAADDDPAGIATYSQAGASYGFQYLWTALFTFPFMAIVQEMCARIGMVTGRGLASAMRQHYPKRLLAWWAIVMFGANAFNIAADFGIMAKSIQLIFPELNFTMLILGLVLLSLGLEIYTTYKSYARILKWVTLALLSYVLAVFMVNIDWSKALTSLVLPTIGFNRESMLMLTAILGTTISPYLFFWQTSQEVEEQILEGKTTVAKRAAVTTSEEIRRMRVDVWFGMLISNMVMFFIIVLCAGTLHAAGIFEIQNAADAAAALRPLAGNAAFFLFTLGIVGTGMLAIPVLAGSSAYAMSEAFGWREGLNKRYAQARAFYGVIIASMVIGLIMNFFHFDVIKMLIYSAVLNGIIAPVILVIIVSLSSRKSVMKEWVNHPSITAMGWLITVLMAMSGLSTLFFLLKG